jgi:hypothetical protein
VKVSYSACRVKIQYTLIPSLLDHSDTSLAVLRVAGTPKISSITSSQVSKFTAPQLMSSLDHTSWALPSNFGQNLSSDFVVKKWEWGKNLVQVVKGVPSSAWNSSATLRQRDQIPSNQSAINTSYVDNSLISSGVDHDNQTALQVFYPKGSTNPENKNAPIGGVGFYSQPRKSII